MKDPVNHKHLSRDKFAAWVNKTLIREVITNHATSSLVTFAMKDDLSFVTFNLARTDAAAANHRDGVRLRCDAQPGWS